MEAREDFCIVKPEEVRIWSATEIVVDKALPVQHYYDLFEGPQFDIPEGSVELMFPHEETWPKGSVELILPRDETWPFLLRCPINVFGICLGTSSQAILWKRIASNPSTSFLHINLKVNFILWWISVVVVALVFCIYTLKIIYFFKAVKAEFAHPVRVNFFFTPWISLLFLALGVPPSIAINLPPSLWYILMTPIVCLELKIYGQWMSGSGRRLSKVANPTNHLAIVGNFVGALLGSIMGLKEGPIFFFGVGLAHYGVLFITLYQRLRTNETLSRDLHPVFFLFVAAPSIASLSWARIQGSFDNGSRVAYFTALFLYLSLAVRINFFRGFKFSFAWWAYTFPMTASAMATIRFSNDVKNIATQFLSALLCAISASTVFLLLVSTVYHAFVLQDLFPNDTAIDTKGVIPITARSKTKTMFGRRKIQFPKNIVTKVFTVGKYGFEKLKL